MDAGNGFMTLEELVDSAYETVVLSDESYPKQREWKKRWLESARSFLGLPQEIPKPSCSMTECIAGIREAIGKEQTERVYSKTTSGATQDGNGGLIEMEYIETSQLPHLIRRVERLERIIERGSSLLRSEIAREDA